SAGAPGPEPAACARTAQVELPENPYAAPARRLASQPEAGAAHLPRRGPRRPSEGEEAPEPGSPRGSHAARATERALEHGFRLGHAELGAAVPLPEHCGRAYARGRQDPPGAFHPERGGD